MAKQKINHLSKIIICLITLYGFWAFFGWSTVQATFISSKPAINYPKSLMLDATNCVSIDLVISIDQSSSMMPEKESPGATDPDDFRTEAAQLLITELMVNQLFECPLARHRWSVINFGDRSQVVQTMTSIPDFDGDDNDELDSDELVAVKAYVDNIEDEIPIITVNEQSDQTFRSLGGTDFRLPFSEAKNQFAVPRSDDVAPKKVLVIITDGGPCVNSAIYICDDATNHLMTSSDRSQFMDEVYQIWQDNYDEQTEIYLIPINTKTDYLTLSTSIGQFPTLLNYWEAITQDRVYEIDNSGRTVTKTITDISQTLLGRDEIYDLLCVGENGGEFFMPPFQEQAQVVVLKDEIDDDFSLQYRATDNQNFSIQDGQIIEPPGAVNDNNFIHLDLKRSEIYRFNQPTPGAWTFQVTSCERISVRLIPVSIQPSAVFPRSTLNAFPDLPYYDVEKPLFYQVDIGGSEADLVAQNLTQFDPIITLRIWHESQPKQIQTIELTQLNDTAIYTSEPNDPVTTPLIGTYYITVTGEFQAPDIENTSQLVTYQLFKDRIYSFAARELTNFSVEILAPTADFVWQMNEIALEGDLPISFPVEIALLQKDGTDFPYDTSGITTNFTVTLQQDNQPSLFIPVANNGLNTHFMANISPELVTLTQNSIFTLTAQFAGSYDDNTYYLRQNVDTLSFPSFSLIGIQPQLSKPPDTVIYTSFLASCSEAVPTPEQLLTTTPISNVSINAQLMVRKNGQLIPLESNLFAEIVSGDITNYFSGTLTAPDGSQQTGLLFIQDGETFKLAHPIENLIQAGTYEFQISFEPGSNLSQYYRSIEAVDQTTFERTYSEWTNPRRCKEVRNLTIATLVVAFLFFLYLATGPFSGQLVFTIDGVTETLPLKRWGFIRRGRQRSYQTGSLDKLGIKRVEVKPTRDEGQVSFEVITYDENGGYIDEVIINTNINDVPLFKGTLKYRR